MNRCGGCTLCCELLQIDALAKPAGKLCAHCTGRGCSIWGKHPAACVKFRCLWRANTTQFGPELRPDRCGAFFEPGGDRVMLVASKPGAWKLGIVWGLIQKCLSEGTAVIVQEPVGDGTTTKHILVPEGDTPPEIWLRTTADAVERGYVR